MKIIVTGGTGFLGRHTVWRLATEGYQVIFTGRQQAAAAEVIAHSPAAVTWLPLEHGTADAAATLANAATGALAVVHCAALSSPWGQYENFVQANITSTEEVIHACETAGVKRLVHISTPSLYFDFRDRLSVREDEPLPTPVNHYAHTKYEAEKRVLVADIAEKVILRPRALFGPWDNTLMPRLVRVMQRGAIPLMREGKALLDLTYVDNAVEAIWLALTKPLPRQLSIYNVTNEEPMQLDVLLAQVADAFSLDLRTRHVPWPAVHALAGLLETYSRLRSGPEPLLTRYGAGVLAFSQTLDTSAIRHELGYVPTVSLAEGIQRHANWWKNQKDITA